LRGDEGKPQHALPDDGKRARQNEMEVTAMAVNKVMVIGNLGANPVVRALASGQNVANFSLATTERFTDRSGSRQARTVWHRVVAFGRLADTCERFLSKGRQVVCCESFIGDGGGPPGVGLQEQIPNHPKLRR